MPSRPNGAEPSGYYPTSRPFRPHDAASRRLVVQITLPPKSRRIGSRHHGSHLSGVQHDSLDRQFSQGEEAQQTKHRGRQGQNQDESADGHGPRIGSAKPPPYNPTTNI